MRPYRCFGAMRTPADSIPIEAEHEAAAAEEYARRRDAEDGHPTPRRIVLIDAGAKFLRFEVICEAAGIFTTYRATFTESY